MAGQRLPTPQLILDQEMIPLRWRSDYSNLVFGKSQYLPDWSSYDYASKMHMVCNRLHYADS